MVPEAAQKKTTSRCLGLANGLWSTRFTKSASTFFPKPETCFFFLPVGSPVMLKMVIFLVAPLKAWRLEIHSNPWQIVFHNAKGVAFCECGSTTLQIMILVTMSSSSISALT